MTPDLRPRDVKLREGYLDEAASELATRSGQESSNILSFLKGDVDTVSGADDAMMQSFKGVKAGMDEAFSEGNFYTRSAIGDMYNNAADSGGDIFAGLSGAGATRSGNAFFQSLSSQEGAGALGGLLVGAGLGAGAAGLVGGDKGEGAMYGAGATMIGRAGAKVLKGAMGEMETTFMKKTLGSKFATEDIAATRNISGGGVSRGNRTYMDSGEIIKDNKVVDTISPADMNILQRQKMQRTGYQPFTDGRTVETGGIKSARSQNLEALKSVDTSDMGTIDKFMVNRINDPNKASIGAQSRTMIASGALLSGMAFSSGRTKDRRSGFNKNRGNRF